jgi:DNA-binding winged helix-turn-helix (wHTH) protein
MKARMSLTQQHSYRFGEFELSVGARCLYRDREPVALGSKAFDVLTCLVVHAGRVVTKEEMLRTVWPDSFVEEGNLAPPNCPSQGRRFFRVWSPSRLPLPADHPAYFRLAKF